MHASVRLRLHLLLGAGLKFQAASDHRKIVVESIVQERSKRRDYEVGRGHRQEMPQNFEKVVCALFAEGTMDLISLLAYRDGACATQLHAAALP